MNYPPVWIYPDGSHQQAILEIHNHDLRMWGIPPQIQELITAATSYPTPQALTESAWKPPEAEVGGVYWDGWIKLAKWPINSPGGAPTGLLPVILDVLAKSGLPHRVEDLRVRPESGCPDVPEIPLFSYQREAAARAVALGRGVLDMPPRCHAEDDPVLLANGQIVSAKSVDVGMQLMGPDGTPRVVLERHEGHAKLYTVMPTFGQPFVVTGNHRLIVEQHRTRGFQKPQRHFVREEVEVTVEEWLSWPKSRKSYLITSGVEEFSGAESLLPLDPYLLGLLIGDGTLTGTPCVSTGRESIRIQLEKLVGSMGLTLRTSPHAGRVPSWRMSNGSGINPVTEALRQLGLWECTARTKFIPELYLTTSRTQRMELLAGLLDTDGGKAGSAAYEIGMASRKTAEGVEFLARSCGFQTTRNSRVVDGWEHWRVRVMGDVQTIPLRTERKHAAGPTWRMPGRTSFTVKPAPSGKYVGWTVSGDHRYLTGGFIVTGNSGKTRTGIEITRQLWLPTIWIAPTKNIVEQTIRAYEQTLGKNFAVAITGSKTWEEHAHTKVIVCTAATAASLPVDFFQTRQVLFFDEVHHAASPQYHDIAMKCRHIFYRYGMTGTFFRSSKRVGGQILSDDLSLHAILSTVIYKVEAADLVAQKRLVPLSIVFVPVKTFPKLSTSGGNYSVGAGRYGIHRHEYRNQLVAWAAAHLHARRRRTLILVATKEQGYTIQEMLLEMIQPHPQQTQFQKVEFVSTDKPSGICQQIIDAFTTTDEVQVLIGTSMVGEGTDVPNCDALVYARGEKAEVSHTQAMYRVGTAHGGKDQAIVVDFMDLHHDTLKVHSQTRAQTYAAETTATVDFLDAPADLPLWLDWKARSRVYSG